jgi:hypothetical protein
LSAAQAAGEFDRFAAAFDESASVEHTLSVAGRGVRLRFGGPAMVPSVLPALAHLEAPADTPIELAIDVWDTASTGRPLPSSPLLPASGRLLRPVWDWGSVAFNLQVSESILTFLDGGRRRALVIAAQPNLPLWERAAPLRILWQRWLAGHGVALVHAAAVACPGGSGCLLTGPGGSGKSTTALLCHRSGLDVAGDDYVLLDPASGTAHSIYRSLKLDWARRDLLAEVANDEREEKALGYMDRPALEVPVGSILLPAVSGGAATRIAAGSSAEALRSLAPRAVIDVIGGGDLFSRLAALARSLPCRRLELGVDEAGVVGCVKQHLD